MDIIIILSIIIAIFIYGYFSDKNKKNTWVRLAIAIIIIWLIICNIISNNEKKKLYNEEIKKCNQIYNPYHKWEADYDWFEYWKTISSRFGCPRDHDDFSYYKYCSHLDINSDRYYYCIDDVSYKFNEWCEQYFLSIDGIYECKYSVKEKYWYLDEFDKQYGLNY